jgi:hypothetical protein
VSSRLVQAEVKVRDPASASDQMNQLLPMRQVSHKHEVIVAAREELDNPGVAVDEDRAPVGSSRDMLDAGDGPCCEIRDQRAPLERSSEREPQREAPVGDEPIGLSSLCS